MDFMKLSVTFQTKKILIPGLSEGAEVEETLRCGYDPLFYHFPGEMLWAAGTGDFSSVKWG